MLETRLLHPTLACEVIGLKLWEKLDEATVAGLRDLYARYGVLVFRRQALSEAELAAFCALLGPLERTVRSDWASQSVPEVAVLSNLQDGLGRPIGGLGDGELQWHSDQSYMLTPATGAALYALELPPEGGETFWVDLRAAYAALPRQLRAQIAGKRGVFDYAKRLAGYGRESDPKISDEARRKTPPVCSRPRSTLTACLSQVTMSPGISTTASARPIGPISRKTSTPPGRRWVRRSNRKSHRRCRSDVGTGMVLQ